MDDDDTSELEQAYEYLYGAMQMDRIVLRVLAEPDGTTYPAICDVTSDEVLALLCIPPRAYSWGTVN